MISIDGNAKREPFIKGVFRFISEGKMEIRALTGNGPRVSTFDSSDQEHSAILTKVSF